jgi:SAM-dependent methyltransferase
MHAGLRRLLARVLPQRLWSQRRRQVFSAIHRDNGWLDPESVSGPGSTEAATRRFRAAVDLLLRDLEIRSLLDVGCGDGNWIHLLETPLERYVGVDIVAALVERRRLTHAGPGREFLELAAIAWSICRTPTSRAPWPTSDAAAPVGCSPPPSPNAARTPTFPPAIGGR